MTFGQAAEDPTPKILSETLRSNNKLGIIGLKR